MKIKILFFGVLIDATNITHLELMDGEVQSTFELHDKLKEIYPLLKNYKYQIALNHTIIKEDLKLNEGDEIAFLPPFAGG